MKELIRGAIVVGLIADAAVAGYVGWQARGFADACRSNSPEGVALRQEILDKNRSVAYLLASVGACSWNKNSGGNQPINTGNATP